MRITTLLPVLSAVLAAVAIPVAHVDNTAARVAAVQETPTTQVASATAHPQKAALAHVDAAKGKYVGRAFAAVDAAQTSTTTATHVTSTVTSSATSATASSTQMAFKEIHAVKPKNVHVERTMPEHLSEDGEVDDEHEGLDARGTLSAEEEDDEDDEDDEADSEAVEVLATLLRRLNKAQHDVDKLRLGYYGSKRGLTKAQQDKLRNGYFGYKRGLTKAQQDKLRNGYFGYKRGMLVEREVPDFTDEQMRKLLRLAGGARKRGLSALKIGWGAGKRGLTKAQQDKLRIGYYGA